MYPKTKLAFLLMLLLLSACKSSHRQPTTEINDVLARSLYNDIIKAPSLPFTTFSVEKTPFRLDFQGQLRTLRASVNCQVDSFTHISLATSFGISVAEIFVTNTDIIFIDHQDKIGYNLDFNYLTQQLQFPFSFKDLQMLIIGYPFLNEERNDYVFSENGINLINYSFSIPCVVDPSKSFGKSFIISLINKQIVQGIYVNSDHEERVSANYTWSKKQSSHLPQSLMIDMLYNDNQIGIDIEYKNATFDLPLAFKRDSTVIIKKLTLDE